MKNSHALDSAYWRRLAWAGASRGPRIWLRLSPGPIGLLAAAVSPRQRDRVRQNLQSLLGQRSFLQEQADVARTFVQFAHSLAESLSLGGHPDRKVRLSVDGAENLHEALAGGNGVILGTAHTAGWEAALMALGDACPAGVVVAMGPERDQGARSFHPLAEPSSSRRVVCVGEDPLASLPLLQHLRKGGIVAIQMDRCPAGMKSLQLQSGRKTWSIPVGPFALSAACGAPIVLALSRRTGFMSYDLRITQPILVPRQSDDGAAQLHAAQKVVRELARHVCASPTQWFDFAPT